MDKFGIATEGEYNQAEKTKPEKQNKITLATLMQHASADANRPAHRAVIHPITTAK